MRLVTSSIAGTTLIAYLVIGFPVFKFITSCPIYLFSKYLNKILLIVYSLTTLVRLFYVKSWI